MFVTVCELADQPNVFVNDWDLLVNTLKKRPTSLLLLPELPFHPWIANDIDQMHQLKTNAVTAHEQWLLRLNELQAEMVIYSKPVIDGELYHNTAYLWDKATDIHHKLHSKHHFPEEEHFWEASLYSPDQNGFEIFAINGINIGVLLCSEMWFTEHAREYGLAGADILLCPRATGLPSVPQWIRCGQTLAVISGAYCLSANKSGEGKNNFQWGGGGWISQPMNGELLGITNPENKITTVEIDLNFSKEASMDYPLNVHQNGKPFSANN